MAAHDDFLNASRRTATVDGSEIKLSRTEYRLLEALTSQPGRALTRAELVTAVMAGAIVLERTIDVHIKTLRQKLGRQAALIQTVRGVGYKFVSFPGADADSSTRPEPK